MVAPPKSPQRVPAVRPQMPGMRSRPILGGQRTARRQRRATKGASDSSSAMWWAIHQPIVRVALQSHGARKLCRAVSPTARVRAQAQAMMRGCLLTDSGPEHELGRWNQHDATTTTCSNGSSGGAPDAERRVGGRRVPWGCGGEPTTALEKGTPAATLEAATGVCAAVEDAERPFVSVRLVRDGGRDERPAPGGWRRELAVRRRSSRRDPHC